MRIWKYRRPEPRKPYSETYDDVYTAMGSMILNAFSRTSRH